MNYGFKIGEFKGFSYPASGQNNNKNEAFTELAQFLIDITNKTYLDRCYIKNSNDEFFTTKYDDINRENEIRDIIKFISSFRKENKNDEYRARIESANYSATLYTLTSQVNNTNFIYLRLNNEIDKTSTLYYIAIEENTCVVQYAGIALYYSVKYGKSKTACKHEYEKIICRNIDNKYIHIIHELIDMNGIDFSSPSYGRTECMLIKHCMKNIKYAGAYDLYTQDNLSHKVDASIFENLQSDIYVDTDRIEAYPLIDFNDIEKSFIISYMKRNDMIDENRSDLTFDIIPHLKDIPYGNIFRFPFKDKEITVSWHVDETNKLLRFGMLEKINDEIVIYKLLDFDKIDTFNSFDNICTITTRLLLDKCNKIPSSCDELKSVSRLLEFEDEVHDMFIYMICAIITIHDKPKRSKMIKITSSKSSSNKSKTVKKNKENEEFVIRRILKSAEDAKEYVRTHTGSTHKDAVYIIEEWDRCGYWRHLKNGKTIWIRETTVHRNLPLSDKEVHIKL